MFKLLLFNKATLCVSKWLRFVVLAPSTIKPFAACISQITFQHFDQGLKYDPHLGLLWLLDKNF